MRHVVEDRLANWTTTMPSILIIGCGALAQELSDLRRLNGWGYLTLLSLPPRLHNRPEQIVPALRRVIEDSRPTFDRIFVAYADCGTGGAIDRLLEDYGIERLPGAHCYEALAGSAAFTALAEAEPATYYLTDFLVRHFDRVVRQGLGLDRHPELMKTYFGNYRRLVYLSQGNDSGLESQARAHAAWLGLDYHRHHCGMTPLQETIGSRLVRWGVLQ